MSSTNKAILLGRLGKDPEVRSTQAGTKCANFSVATSEKWKDKNTGEAKEKTEWHNVVVWGALASVCENYLKKGSQVYIEGKLQTRKWQDRDGQDKYTTEVVIKGFGSNLVMCGGKNEGNGGGNQAPHPASSGASAPSQADLDDEIPF